MAGRLGNKLKGFVAVWYGIVLLLGFAAGIVAVLYWIYLLFTSQTGVDWGVVVLISFIVIIVSLAVFFLPRFRARRED